MFLIDTSVWIYALRKDFNPEIKIRVDKILIEGEVATTGIIQLELLGGAKRKSEYERLKKRLDSLYYVESGKDLWDFSSKLCFEMKRQGITVPYTDLFIASIALKTNSILVHADKHLDMIAQFSKSPPLRVESFVGSI